MNKFWLKPFFKALNNLSCCTKSRALTPSKQLIPPTVYYIVFAENLLFEREFLLFTVFLIYEEEMEFFCKACKGQWREMEYYEGKILFSLPV